MQVARQTPQRNGVGPDRNAKKSPEINKVLPIKPAV